MRARACRKMTAITTARATGVMAAIHGTGAVVGAIGGVGACNVCTGAVDHRAKRP